MRNFQRTNFQRGFSLIEVLIAVLIFTLGLLGVAALLVLATQANHGGYVRTQVTYLAHNMADRMSANPIAVWNGAYNSSFYPISGTSNCNAGCSVSQLATYDQQAWSRQLETFLAEPQASISCRRAGSGFAVTTAQMETRPPFGGTCTMTITWNDRGYGGESDRETAAQTFAWEFQP